MLFVKLKFEFDVNKLVQYGFTCTSCMVVELSLERCGWRSSYNVLCQGVPVLNKIFKLYYLLLIYCCDTSLAK